mmetsp:Transcript_6737/g.18039  ORF Transcript_6737/g.18039 Transcript_6737/m.18039 type:complete len:216 (-) Transcript_6737:70-717(-)
MRQLGKRGDEEQSLACKLHDRANNVPFSTLQGFHSLSSGNVCLSHHQLNILGLHTALVHGLIVLLRCSCLLGGLWGLHLRLLELLSCLGAGLGTQVLDLGLAENDVCVRGRALEHVWCLDDEQDVLALLDCDACDAGHGLHPQLLHGLPALLFRAALLATATLLPNIAVLAGHLLIIILTPILHTLLSLVLGVCLGAGHFCCCCVCVHLLHNTPP